MSSVSRLTRLAPNVLGIPAIALLSGCYIVLTDYSNRIPDETLQPLLQKDEAAIITRIGEPAFTIDDGSKTHLIYRRILPNRGYPEGTFAPGYATDTDCLNVELREGVFYQYNRKSRATGAVNHLGDCRSLFWSREQLERMSVR